MLTYWGVSEMTSSDNKTFLGLRQLPSCTHPPKIRLLTTGFKSCVECALDYLVGLSGVVEYFDIQDGPLNGKATAYGLRRQESPTQTPNQTPIESGG